MVRLIALISGVAAAVAAIMTPIFIWDGVKSAGDIGKGGALPVYAATGLASLKLVLGALICGAITVGAWTRRGTPPESERGTAAKPGGGTGQGPEPRTGGRIIGKD
jgi:hypothetical protein